MTVFVCFLCASLTPTLQITNNSKESIFKLGMDGDETERRKEMVKLVICDGSLPYRRAQLSFLTWQLISGYCSEFTWSLGKPIQI